jgi:hypothetical protein
MNELQEYGPWVEVEEDSPNDYDFPYDTSDDDAESAVVNDAAIDAVNDGEEPAVEVTAEGDEAAEEEINISFFLADALRQKGILNLDNVPDNITEEEVVQLYANSHEQRIQQQVLDTLQQRGITEKNLQMAMAIENGYSPDFLLEQNRYKAFADLKNQDEVARDVKDSVVSQWLQSRDLFEDEIKERKDTYELNDDIFETDYNRAISYFENQYKEFEKQNELTTMERQRATFEVQRKNKDLLDSVESKGIIAGEKMTATQLEDFKRGLRLQEEIVEVNGQPYRASKFDKFIYDIQNNFETQLLAFKLLMFRDMDRKIIEQEAAGKAEESLFKGMTSRLTKSAKLSVPASTTRKSADGTRTFEIPKNARVVTLGQ